MRRFSVFFSMLDIPIKRARSCFIYHLLNTIQSLLIILRYSPFCYLSRTDTFYRDAKYVGHLKAVKIYRNNNGAFPNWHLARVSERTLTCFSLSVKLLL